MDLTFFAGNERVETIVEPGVLQLDLPPQEARLPIILDSPHSGSVIPADFGTIVPLAILRKVQDSYVDELFEDGVGHGATLLRALFPRSYIDPNRSELDIDVRLLAHSWPGQVRPSDKTRLGHGLIWRTCPTDRRMYDRRLSTEEVTGRIERYWRPYHQALRDAIEEAHARFGMVWHINCHSMPASSAPIVSRKGRSARADIVLGDRDGRACDPELIHLVGDWLQGQGYTVRFNDPYKGAYLVEAYANPARGLNSLQIELNRSLYMDETSLKKSPAFDALRDDMAGLVAYLAGELGSRRRPAAAE